MAAFLVLRESSSPENKPSHTSRRRHHGSNRTESRSRRPQSEHTHSHSHSHYNIRSSPPRQSQSQPPNQWSPSPILMTGHPPKSGPSHSAAFQSAPLEHSTMAGITMERTPSGNSIMSDTPIHYSSHHDTHTLTCADSEAARRVEKHFHSKRLSSSHRKHERILKKLIRRDDPFDDGSIDDHALAGILTTADTLFFDGVLSRRVQWEWSSGERYHHELIGTTALRRCPDRDGFETLIVLSEPILRNPAFDRRLLLSTFLHELIHCYLFISCGFEARMQGGHTDGFHRIARVIDSWVGEGYLSLCHMKANLDFFRRDIGGEYGCVDGHGLEECNQSQRRDGVVDSRGFVMGYV